MTQHHAISIGDLTLNVPAAWSWREEELDAASFACLAASRRDLEARAAAARTIMRLEAGFGLGDLRRAPIREARDARERLVHERVSDPAARDREVWRREQMGTLGRIDAEVESVVQQIEEARSIPGVKKRRKAMRPLNARLNKLGDDRLGIVRALAEREEEERTQARIAELAQLEALRGGQVLIEEVEVETPVVENWRGHQVQAWHKGERVKERERLVRPVVTSRDGLYTLATAHLKANGEPRLDRDGRPMVPQIGPIEVAAGERYRTACEEADPERGLHAIDPADVLGGRVQDDDPFGEKACKAMFKRVEASKRLKRLDLVVKEAAGAEGVLVVREVAGMGRTIRSIAGHGRRNSRLTMKLVVSLQALADHFGLW